MPAVRVGEGGKAKPTSSAPSREVQSGLSGSPNNGSATGPGLATTKDEIKFEDSDVSEVRMMDRQ